MSLVVPAEVERQVDDLIPRYPQKRSASLMVLHTLQEHYGFLSVPAIEWTARKLGLQPINVLELVTFYPMFRQQAVGKYHFKICRTLSCMLGGAYELHHHVCGKLGLNPDLHGPQTTADGKFTVEFVECLASCGTAPVMMLNDQFHEGVQPSKADRLIEGCGKE